MTILTRSMNQNLYLLINRAKKVDSKIICRGIVNGTVNKQIWAFTRLRDFNRFIS